MVDFVALVTPPILVGPNGEPAQGKLYAHTTNTFALPGVLVVPYSAQGLIKDGAFTKLDGSPYLLPVTPEGGAIELVAEIFQDVPGGQRTKHYIRRTVSTPNASTVTWDALVDVVPVDTGSDYEVPAWVTQLLADAVSAAGPTITAKNEAVAAAELAIEAAASVPTEAELTATFVPRGNLAEGAAWGSSSIAGTGATASTNLVGRLSALLGITIYNGGNGGELVTHHAARSGAVPALVTIAPGAIPASGAVAVTVENFTATRLDRFRSTVGTLFGIRGTLAYSGSTLQFTRASTGSLVRVPNRMPFIPDGDSYRSLFTILWPGKNTLVESTPNPDEVIAYTRRMDAHAGGVDSRTIVLGHFVDSDTPAVSAARTAITTVNAQYAVDYGERYIDVQSFMCSRFVWYVTGISPTTADLAAQAAGNKPPSLSYDALHFNEAGYNAIAWLVAAHLKQLGWFSVTLPALPAEPTFPVVLPAKITGLTVTPGDGQLTAAWNADGAATSYKVESRTGGGAWTSQTVSGVSAVITGTNGSAYEVRVSGVNTSGTGPASDIATATPTAPSFRVFTSDGFSGDAANVIGRSTDAALGGTAKSWQGSTALAAFATASGQLVKGASVSSQFVAIPMPHSRQKITAKITGVAAGAAAFIVARRGTLAASNSYRISLNESGFARMEKTAGSTPTGVGASTDYAAGDIVSLDCDGETITFSKNGTVVSTITDSTVTTAGFAGVSVSGGTTAVALDDLVIESLY